MRFIGLIILIILASFEARADVVIRGKVKGADISAVYVLLPLNGFSNETIDFYSRGTALNKQGEYTVSFPVDKAIFVKIRFDNYPLWLIVEPGELITIDIDFSKNFPIDTGGLSVKGRNASGIILLNKINFYPATKFSFIPEMLSAHYSKVVLFEKFKDSVNVILNQFIRLKSQHTVSTAFFDVASNSFKLILLAELINKLRQSRYYAGRLTPADVISFCDKYMNVAKGIYDPLIYRCYLNVIYYNEYFLLKTLADRHQQLDKLPTDSLFKSGNKIIRISSDFVDKLYIKSDYLREHCWAYLQYNIYKIMPLAIQEGDQEYFKTFFPSSLYHPVFFQVQKGTELLSGTSVNYIDSTGLLMQSLKDIIDNYKNKKPVFIDLWASWCLPCRDDFSHNTMVDSALKQYGIKRLYVSLDDTEMFKKNWLNTINYYRLSGDHIIAGALLQEDIKKEFFSDEQVSIPRYILIAKDGRIISKEMPRPSETGRFLEALKQNKLLF